MTGARHIGRIGALAITLGVGAAVATSPGVACAEPSNSGSASSSPSPSGTTSASPSSSPARTPDDAASSSDSAAAGDAVSPDVSQDTTSPGRGTQSSGLHADPSTSGTGHRDELDIDGEDESTATADHDEPPPGGTHVNTSHPAPDDTAILDEMLDLPSAKSPAAQREPGNRTTAGTAVRKSAQLAAIADVEHPQPATQPRPRASIQQRPPANAEPIAAAPAIVRQAAATPTVTLGAAAIRDSGQPAPASAADLPDTLVSMAGQLVSAVFGPLLSSSPGTPVPQPSMLWVVLGWVRREIQHTLFNRSPVATSQQAVVELDDPTAISDPIRFKAVDIDGDPLTYSVPDRGTDSGPQHGTVTVDQTTGTFTYDPDDAFAVTGGTETFTVTVSDASTGFHLHGLQSLFGAGNPHTDTATVTITVKPTHVNAAPTAGDDNAIVAEGASTPITVLANDADADGNLDPATVTITSGPAHGSATVNPDGTITYQNNGDEDDTDTFTYTVNDDTGAASNTATVHITVTPVDDAPVAVNDTTTIAEDSGPVTVTVTDNDTDVDGGPKQIIATDILPATVGAVSFTGDTITYTPAANFNGTATIGYTLNEGSTAVLSITVIPQDEILAAFADTASTDEDTAVTIDVLANDTSPDGFVSLSIVTGPSNGTAEVIDGKIRYTPAVNATGTDSFIYRATDADGDTANATVTVTITAVNDPPLALDDNATVDEGSTSTIDVLANDSDPDDALDTTSVRIAQNPTNGTVTVNPDGTITYQSDGANVTADSFTYTVDDNAGATSNTATVHITITPVIDAAEAVTAAHDALHRLRADLEIIDRIAIQARADNNILLLNIATRNLTEAKILLKLAESDVAKTEQAAAVNDDARAIQLANQVVATARQVAILRADTEAAAGVGSSTVVTDPGSVDPAAPPAAEPVPAADPSLA